MEFHDTRILIADENTHQRSLLREALNRGGYRYVEEASGGEEALAKIERTHPDVAIIDIWLSQLDGIGVIRACRNLDFRSDPPPVFIMTSPISNQNMFIQAAGAGAAATAGAAFSAAGAASTAAAFSAAPEAARAFTSFSVIRPSAPVGVARR